MAFYNGPLNKSIYTQQFELFTKCLLACPNAVSFGYDSHAGKKQLYGIVNNSDIKVNVSELLTKTDFTHISLSESDSKAYFKHYDKNALNNSSGTESGYQYDPNGKCPRFMQAEYSAIKDYTGSAYYGINNFMYKNGTNYDSELNGKVQNNNQLALDLIQMMFISSGLNKIMPDTEQSENLSFRGEHHTSQAEIQLRIDSIKSPDSFITTPAYTSTSSDNEVAKNFSGDVLIKYEGLYGKSIECISNFPHEKEYLLQPSKIQWIEHNEENKQSYGHNVTTHEFKARVVRPLIEEENNPDFNDIESFKKLVDWAEKNHIDTGFITEHNKNIYLYDCLCDNTLNLEDTVACVVEKALIFVFDGLIDCGKYIGDAIDCSLDIKTEESDILAIMSIHPDPILIPFQDESTLFVL